eukprot:722165-Prymnesium_polylepis.1
MNEYPDRVTRQTSSILMAFCPCFAPGPPARLDLQFRPACCSNRPPPTNGAYTRAQVVPTLTSRRRPLF